MKSSFLKLATALMATIVVGIGGATGAQAEGITGSRKVDATIEQTTEVKGDQIAAAIGNRASAANINSSIVAAEVSGRITQKTTIGGKQIAAAIGNRASALNLNSSIIGGYSY